MSGEHGRDGPRGVVPLFLVTATLTIGYGSVFTLLADLRHTFGFTESALGVIVAAGFLAGFAAQVALSRYSDRGHARFMVLAGIVMAALAFLWLSIATALWQFVVARMLFGVGSGMVSPSMRRVVISRFPEHVGTNLGRMAAWEVGGFVVGPLLAGGLAELGGLRTPFLTIAGLILALLPFVLRLDLSVGAVSTERRVVRVLLSRPALVAGLAAGVAFSTTLGMFEAVWAVLLADHGAETWLIAVSLSAFTVPMILVAPFGGRLAQRHGPLRTATLGISVAIACTVAYGFAGTLAGRLMISIVHAAADGLTMPSNQVAIAVASPAAELASAQGLMGAVGLATAGIAGAAAATVYEHFGERVLFTGTGAVMLLALATARVLGTDLLHPPVATPALA